MRDIVISLKRNKISKSRNAIIFFAESIVNESRFSSACNRIHNCQNDDSETIKTKKSTFSKT
jgi:hypothetical protein